MHLATAEALVDEPRIGVALYRRIAQKYIESMDDMEGRKPGPTSIQGCKDLRPNEEYGVGVPFNPNASGKNGCPLTSPLRYSIYSFPFRVDMKKRPPKIDSLMSFYYSVEFRVSVWLRVRVGLRVRVSSVCNID